MKTSNSLNSGAERASPYVLCLRSCAGLLVRNGERLPFQLGSSRDRPLLLLLLLLLLGERKNARSVRELPQVQPSVAS